MKHFTSADLIRDNHIIIELTADLIDAPLPWQKQGLQQTASGYGRKLTSSRKISYNGKAYRLYATCYSNAASHWFTCKGQRIYVD